MLRSIKSAILFTVMFAAAIAGARSLPQEDQDDPAKAAALIREAIAARGGDAYLSVRSLVSRGQFTAFEKGVSGDPVTFVDYIIYPSRERTEFGKGGTKFIQTNSDGTGWVYDANQKMIRDQKEEQIKQFEQGSRFDLDNLLRVASRQPNVKLVYLGRREAWRSNFSEALRIDFADGNPATLHIDPHTKLPMMVEYKTTGEGGTVNNEVRYFRWVDFNGVKFPTIQDAYRDGKQSSRASFDTFSVNPNLPEELFAKPASVKEVK